MPHRFNARRAALLLDPQRLRWQDPEEILDWLGLGAGETLLDLGCGPGFFSVPAARRVGTAGRVLALDVSRAMLRLLSGRAASEGVGNVVPVRSGPVHLPFVGQVADHALLANVFHELDRPETTLSQLRVLLRPGGSLGILDWREDEDEPGPPKAHRSTLEEMERLARAAGFTPQDPVRRLRHHVFLRLRADA